jgi:hypothetical protein
MLEVHLRAGPVVAFDGRVVEVFVDGGPSRRFHITQLGLPEAAETADGGRTLTFEGGAATLWFAREEVPACARLLAAIGDAQATLARGNRG